jgi:Anaphase-promoting complex subunit 5
MIEDDHLSLQPSNVAYIATIIELIASGRKKSDAVHFQDPTSPLQILCFLGDRIQLQNVKHYLNANDFLSELLSTFEIPENDLRTPGHFFVDKVRDVLSDFKSVDDLVHFVDSIQNLLTNDVSISPNESVAPYRICPDSSLGTYCRCFFAKWECLSFEFVCQLYESLAAFTNGIYCASDDFALTMGQLSRRPIVHVGMGVQSYLQQADEAAQTGDVHAAERLLHRYFDFNGNDPLLSVASKGSSSSTSQQALAALHHAKDPQFTGTRHQQALLQLASMWSCSGHYSLAMAAVEEAMKTAHQRGDHNSVARALLLLYHVVSGLNTSEQGCSGSDSSAVSTIRAEEVLRRCLHRCSTLGMNALASQAAALLSQLLSTRPLTWTQTSYLSHWLAHADEDFDVGQGADSSNTNSNSVKNTWNLIQCTQLGEAKLCNAISKNDNVPGIQAIAIIPAAAPVKDVSRSLSPSEFQSIQAQSDQISMDYWCRLGLPSFAELQCRRTLRAFHSSRSSQMSNEMILSLGCKLASLIAASVFEDLDEMIFKKICKGNCVVVEVKDPLAICTRRQKNVVSNCDTNTKRKYRGCSAAMNILRMTQRVVSSISSNHAGNRISCLMETTRTYIATLHSLIEMEADGFGSSKSFRLAQRLVDLCSVEGQGHSMSMSGGRAETHESARASLLFSRILQLHNRKEAQELLGRLEIAFLSSGLHQSHAEAVALFAFFSVTKSAGERTLRVAARQHTSQKALLLLHRTLAVARRHHYPVVESNICQYVSLITNFLT